VPRQRSSAVPLAWSFALLIVYASLYPFSDWRWPPGHDLLDLMRLPWPPYRPKFDIFSNLVGYLPMGALAYGAGLRSGWRWWAAMLLGVLAPALLSFTMEVTQNFLPQRVPSRLDLALNAAGGALGMLAGVLLQATGMVGRWQAVRDRWFLGGSAGARALLLLWPVGLLFPAPVPLGLGQVAQPLRDGIAAAVADTPWAEPVLAWISPPVVQPSALPPLAEGVAIMLGLLAPCLLAHAAVRPGPRRIVLALGAAVLAAGATTLSTLLNFGPGHALSWITPTAPAAFGAALAVACALAWIGRRLAAGLALVCLTALIALVAQAPADPYFAQSLQAWQQGRFIRFHGLAQWVGWLWPYLAMVWLLMRLAARRER
jgi:VanZ family protein